MNVQNFLKISGVCALIAFGTFPALADDLSDGISEFTDESISADDNIGGKDTNISFIVADSIGKAKVAQAKAKKKGSSTAEKSSKTNYYDGTTENNENSVVVGPGSNVDSVYNIIIEK